MRTKSEKFIFEKRQRWKNLLNILEKISKKSFDALTETEVDRFPRLYRLTCSDLAEARMLKLSPDVIDYLNSIIGQAHKYLYNFPVISTGRIRRFFLEDMPEVLFRFKNFILLSAALFLFPLFISFTVTASNPKIAASIVDESLLSQMENSYKNKIGDQRSAGEGTSAFSFYIYNNITVAFISFALGILAGLGTAYILIQNGIVIGTIGGYITGLGYGSNFLNFVCAHSVFELSGLVIAGAAGLYMGYTIIKGGKYSRKDALNSEKKNILTILSPAVFLISIAAVIEGNLSPSLLPFEVKALTALASLAIFIYYFFLLPGRRRHGL